METDQMITTECTKWHMKQMQNEMRDMNLQGLVLGSLHATLMSSDFILWALENHQSILSNNVSWTGLCFRGKIAPNYYTVIIQTLDISRHKSPCQDSASGDAPFIYLLILAFLIPNISDLSVHSNHLWKCGFWYGKVGMRPKSLHFLQAPMLRGVPVHGR